jgi:hypothetical protein
MASGYPLLPLGRQGRHWAATARQLLGALGAAPITREPLPDGFAGERSQTLDASWVCTAVWW